MPTSGQFSLSTSGNGSSAYALYSAVKTLVLSNEGQGDLMRVSELLDQPEHQRSLRQPLAWPTPSSADRTSVGSSMSTDHDKLVAVLRLSDDLNLNEILAAELWDAAAEADVPETLDDLGAEPVTDDSTSMEDQTLVALRLFFFQRSCVLRTLALLLQLRNPNLLTSAADASISQDMPRDQYCWVLERTDELLVTDKVNPQSHTLSRELMDRIESHSERLRALVSSPQLRGTAYLGVHVAAFQQERRLMCESLFALFYHTQAEDKEATHLLELTMSLSNRWVSNPEEFASASSSHDDSETNQGSASLEAMYLLLMTVAGVLDRRHEMYDRYKTRHSGLYLASNSLPHNTTWMQSTHSMLMSASINSGNNNNQPYDPTGRQWRHDGVHGVVLLFWGLFLAQDDTTQELPQNASELREKRVAVMKCAFHMRALAFLRGILRSPQLAHDNLRELIVGLVDETLVGVISMAASDATSVSEDDTTGELLRPRAQLLEEARHRFEKRIPSVNTPVGAPAASQKQRNPSSMYRDDQNLDGLLSSTNEMNDQQFGFQKQQQQPQQQPSGFQGGWQQQQQQQQGSRNVNPTSTSQGIDDIEVCPDALEDLVSLVAQTCRLEPHLAHKYWSVSAGHREGGGEYHMAMVVSGDNNNGNYDKYDEDSEAFEQHIPHAVRTFISDLQQRVSMSSDPESLYCVYLNFLAASAVDQRCGEALFKHLVNSASADVSLERIKAALRHYHDQFYHVVTNANGGHIGVGVGTGAQGGSGFGGMFSGMAARGAAYGGGVNGAAGTMDGKTGGVAGSSGREGAPPESYIAANEQAVLTVMLRVLAAALCSGAVCESLLATSSITGGAAGRRGNFGFGVGAAAAGGEHAVDDHLLLLARLDLSAPLKAQVWQTLAALAKSRELALRLWRKLEQRAVADNMMAMTAANNQMNNTGFGNNSPLNNNSNNKGGNLYVAAARFDLEGKETETKRYVGVAGFMDLIWQLLLHSDMGDMASELLVRPSTDTNTNASATTTLNSNANANAGGSPVDLQPFIDFVIHEVLLRYDQRGYAQEGERWRVVAACLRILHLTVERFDVAVAAETLPSLEHVTNTPGFGFMAEFLQGGQVFRKVADILVTCGGPVHLQRLASGKIIPAPTLVQPSVSAANIGMNNTNNTTGKKLPPWFLVSGVRRNLDSRVAEIKARARGSLANAADSSKQGYSYGMLRPRNHHHTTSHSGTHESALDDCGVFAAWLADPTTSRALFTRDDPASRWSSSYSTLQTSDMSGNASVPVPVTCDWDDGDPGAQWCLHSVKLTLRVLVSVMHKETSFMEFVQQYAVDTAGQVDRLHRLLLKLHGGACVAALGSFVCFDLSNEAQLQAIKLLYALGARAKAGALVDTLLLQGRSSRMYGNGMSSSRGGGSLMDVNGRLSESELIDKFLWALRRRKSDMGASADDNNTSKGKGLWNQSLALMEAGLWRLRPERLTPSRSMDADGIVRAVADDLDLERFATQRVQSAVLELLLAGLKQPKVNLAQVLLGLRRFEDAWEVNEAVTGHNCLAVLIGLLDEQLIKGDVVTCEVEEQIYELLVTLCGAPNGGKTMLGALRDRHDSFWCRHVSRIVRAVSKTDNRGSQQKERVRNQIMSWVLEGAALELSACVTGMRAENAAAQDILHAILIGRGGSESQSNSEDQSQMLVLQVVDALAFELPEPEPPALLRRSVQTANASMAAGVGDACMNVVEDRSGHAFEQFDLQVLIEAIGAMDKVAPSSSGIRNNNNNSSRSGPRSRTGREAAAVRTPGNNTGSTALVAVDSDMQATSERDAALEWALEWNTLQRLLVSRANVMSAWRNLMEVALWRCGRMILSSQGRDSEVSSAASAALGSKLLADILDALLHKLIQNAAAPISLIEPVAVVSLSILAVLRASRDTSLSSSAGGVAAGSGLSFLSSPSSSTSSSLVLARKAVLAATGAYSLGYRVLNNSHASSEMDSSLVHMSASQHRQILVGLLDALEGRKRGGSDAVGGTAGDVNARICYCLYGCIAELLMGTRELYSAALRQLSPTLDSAVSDPREQLRTSELAFLNSTGGTVMSGSGRRGGGARSVPLTMSNPWQAQAQDSGAGGCVHQQQQQGPMIENLRNRALGTMDALENGNRGLVLLEMTLDDATQPRDSTIRAAALGLFSALLACDRAGKWMQLVKRKRAVHFFIDVCVRHIEMDLPTSNNASANGDGESDPADQLYSCTMTALMSMAQQRDGALSIVESGFLSHVCAGDAISVLCDKRALSAWEHPDASAASSSRFDSQREKQASLQERRHYVVLPLLRLIVTLLTTLSASPENSSTHKHFKSGKKGGGAHLGGHSLLWSQVLTFISTQRRWLSSVLGFPPTCLSDLEEAALAGAILSRCATTGGLMVQTLGGLCTEIDTQVQAYARELCLPVVVSADGRPGRQWDQVVPVSADEHTRAASGVSSPRDLHFGRLNGSSSASLGHSGLGTNGADVNGGTSGDSVSLFDLDKHSLELMVLKRLSAYLSARQIHLLKTTMETSKSEGKTAPSSSSEAAPVQQTTGECMGFAVMIDATATAVNTLLEGCTQNEARVLLGAALAAWSSGGGGSGSTSLASINQNVADLNDAADSRRRGAANVGAANLSSRGFAGFSLGQSVKGRVGGGVGGEFGTGLRDGSGHSSAAGVVGGRVKDANSWHMSTHYMVHALEGHLFVLETALLCLYAKLRALGKHAPKSVSGPELVGNVLEHAQLLAFYYGCSHDRSALEGVEVHLRETSEGEPFILSMLRRMRDLYHRGENNSDADNTASGSGFGKSVFNGASSQGMFGGSAAGSGGGLAGFGGVSGPYGMAAGGGGGFNSFGR